MSRRLITNAVEAATPIRNGVVFKTETANAHNSLRDYCSKNTYSRLWSLSQLAQREAVRRVWLQHVTSNPSGRHLVNEEGQAAGKICQIFVH